MAVNTVETIGAIEIGDGTAILEPEDSCKHHDLHSAGDCHAILAPRLEIAHKLLPILVAEGSAKNPSQHIIAGDQLRLHT